MACKYANVFGEPNTGLHAYRVANVAVVDVLLTVVAAAFLSIFTKSFGWTLVGLFVLGIVMHRIFCVRTTVDRLLF
jgi:hypothetical protein